MYTGKLVYSQVLDFMPMHTFRRCVQRYHGNHHVKRFTCLDQFHCMAFAQLTFRESLRDIEACLRAQQNKLHHMGIRAKISRSTLAEANEKRDWRIYADLAHHLIHRARDLYATEDFGVDLNNTVYALDASTIDLCLSLFPWAHFRQSKAAIKLHTLLDLRGNIPTFIHISDGKLHDVNALDLLIPEPGAFYIMDRGYLDFTRLFRPHTASSFFVTRAKSNSKFRRLYSTSVDKTTGLICDQTVVLTGFYSAQRYPEKLRRIKYYDATTDKTFVFLTNNFSQPALTIAELYRCRWQVELFFKWLKQHLKIKKFWGTTENAVRIQIYVAMCIYCLVAIVQKDMQFDRSTYEVLQILSISLTDKTNLRDLFDRTKFQNDKERFRLNEPNLFNF